MSKPVSRIAFLLLGSVLLVPACRKPPPAGEPEVKGRVEDADGNPLPRVLVRFHSVQDDKAQYRTISCLTDESGAFSGKCPPGEYKITLLAVQDVKPPAEKEKGKPPPPSLPPGVAKKYGSLADTPWQVTVPPGGKKDLVLQTTP